ncbi:MAG TPA: CRISPR system precrRNA processing endoribonuclease RAMP protein Cas6 [Ktedonobacteraceae bacterium]|nr:CRISPR system precrRNA processing endoribonuclease RAMP protein Cas6 [Ktedonobacteraceae bacterium]
MKNLLYSLILELTVNNATTLPISTGYQTYSLFLNIISQVDPVLAARMHEESNNYRPFTISSLRGPIEQGKNLLLQPGQLCRLRVTLLDGGPLWQALCTCFLEGRLTTVTLDTAELTLRRLLSTPGVDPTGWAGSADWQTLATTAASDYITVRFASPTAFSLGDRRFGLFPEPRLVWDSLMRSWNLYAPEVLRLDKVELRAFVGKQVVVEDYHLQTETRRFPTYSQKGFVGTCTYHVKVKDSYAPQVAALAEFARYSGIGYKTTMGMGQACGEVDRMQREETIEESDSVAIATEK